jgi:predicted permease
MSAFSRIRSWLRSVTHRTRLEDRMDEELAFHLESRIVDLIRQGLSREEAARTAKIEFGSTLTQKEEMRASLGLRWWDDLRADLRYAVRMLANAPGFTLIAIGSLALGIGANTAIFTLAKQVLLDRLNVPHPEELVLFHWTSQKDPVVHHEWGDWDKHNGINESTSFPYPFYLQLREHNKDLFAFKDPGRMNVSVNGEADAVQGEMISGNFYQVLDVQPVLGRPIIPADDAVPGSGAVVVISDGFWTKHFGRSPSVIGKSILLNAIPFTIIGVNPPRFTGAKGVHTSPDVFLPLSMQPIVSPNHKGSLLDDPTVWWMQIMMRRKAGVPVQTMQAALEVPFQAFVAATNKPQHKDEVIPNLSLQDGSRGMNESARRLTQPVYVLLSLVGLVLLLACANIANLLLARSAARQREMSVRMALGAGRMRILRQVLTESLLLSSAGGLAGLALGYLGRNAIPKLMSTPWETVEFHGSFDLRVFAFTAAISIFTGLLFGLAPAWKSMRTEVNSELKDGAQTITHRRKGLAGKSIVAFQVTLSTLLVVGAALFVRTLANLDSVDPGFRADHVLLFDIRLPGHHANIADVLKHHAIEDKLAAVPGVGSAALSAETLIANSRSMDDFIPVGMEATWTHDSAILDNAVSPRFFSTMGIPIIAGRGFQESDTATSPRVAIINRALAREIFPNTNPIGKTFAGYISDKTIFQIVGICADTHYDSLRNDPPPTYYVDYRQLPDLGAGANMTYEIRTLGNPDALVPSLRRAVQSIDKNLPLIDVRTQQEQIDSTIQQERIFASLTAAFGLLALTLASIGIYGIMAYNVSRRTNEIGIRLALGAQARQILTMVLGETSWLAITGVGVGLGAALLLTRFLKTMLFGLKPSDPLTMIGAGAMLFAVALLAGFIPARRASRVEPMQALRHE